MANNVDPQEHLDSHYGDLDLRLVDEPVSGEGMTSKEVRSFLQGLRPVARVKQTLKEAAQRVKKKA